MMNNVSTGVTEQLVDCSGGDEITLVAGQKRKLDALAELLGRHTVPRTIVFCNKIDTCRAVENFLNRRDEEDADLVLPCHAAIAPHTRQNNLRTFLGPPQAAEPRQILVCTDRCAVDVICCFCTMRQVSSGNLCRTYSSMLFYPKRIVMLRIVMLAEDSRFLSCVSLL